MDNSGAGRGLLLGTLLVTIAGCRSEIPFPSSSELDDLKTLRATKGFRNEDATNRLFEETANAPQKRTQAELLGDQFFHEAGFGPCEVSCASCHIAPSYADPGLALSRGCGTAGRNTPSLLNLRYTRHFFWDGRAAAAWTQAVGPLLNPDEIGATADSVRARILEDGGTEGYASRYQTVFGTDAATDPDGRLLTNVGKVIQMYLWTDSFVSLDSPFDRALEEFIPLAEDANESQSESARSRLEKHPFFLGLKVFTRSGGCILCHKNGTFSDDDFHNIGVSQLQDGVFDQGLLDGYEQLLEDPFSAAKEWSDDLILGRTREGAIGALVDRGDSKGAFKTPSLRNVALTGPYMHNGKLESLEEVVKFYDQGGAPHGFYPGIRAKTVAPLDLSDDERAALVELLRSMTSDALAR